MMSPLLTHLIGLNLNGNQHKGRKTLKDIREFVKGCSEIYLASDPDREGEAIAWHILEHLKDKN